MNKLIIRYNNNIIIDKKNSVQALLPVQAANKPTVTYTYDGLEFSAGEKKNQFALIMYDPDAPSGTHIHWVVVNISGIGLNLDSHGTTVCDYKGPSPPPGKPHRYIFLLYQQTEGGEIPKDVIESLKTKLNQSRIMNIDDLLSPLQLSNLEASVTFMSQTKGGRKGKKGKRGRKMTKRRWRQQRESKRRTRTE